MERRNSFVLEERLQSSFHRLSMRSWPAAVFGIVLLTGCSSSTIPATDASTDARAPGDAGETTEAGNGSGGDGGGSSEPDAGGGAGGSAGSGGADAGAGGTDSDPDSGTGQSDTACASDAECDDGIDCTIDTCLKKTCSHTIDDSQCAAGTACDPRAGRCVDTTTCGEDDDCVDEDPCTRDEQCDAGSAKCVWHILDQDQDGHAATACGGDDFNDDNAASYPGAIDICDDEDNDDDGAIDEAPDALEDCRNESNAGFVCRKGACEIAHCPDLMSDCDDDLSNGCETSLNSEESCGECGYSCHSCVDGECGPGACDNFDDSHIFETVTVGTNIYLAMQICRTRCSGTPTTECQARCIQDRSGGYFSSGCRDCLAVLNRCIDSQCSSRCDVDGADCKACECSSQCLGGFYECSGLEYRACEE